MRVNPLIEIGVVHIAPLAFKISVCGHRVVRGGGAELVDEESAAQRCVNCEKTQEEE